MLEKFEKIEELVNMILGKLISLFWVILHKVLPSKLFTKTNELKKNTAEKLNNAKSSASSKITVFFFMLLNKIKLIKAKVDILRAIDYKAILKEKMHLILKTLKELTIKKVISNTKIFFAPYIFQIKTRFKSIKKSQFYIVSGSMILLIIGSVSVYDSFVNIYEKEFPYREPASVQEYDYRPDYKLYERKSLKVFNIKIPVYSEDVGNVTSITVDFSLRTSTRYARFYLSEYEYKLKDHFFTHVEMITSEFPLEAEGKTILKAKIIEELNIFLEQEEVEGIIEDVNILFMIAT